MITHPRLPRQSHRTGLLPGYELVWNKDSFCMALKVA